jgi:hypothetical protein
MSKRKLLVKRFLIYWVVAAFLLLYFLTIFVIGLTVHPFLAVFVLFLTFGVVYLLSLRFYDLLAETL